MRFAGPLVAALACLDLLAIPAVGQDRTADLQAALTAEVVFDPPADIAAGQPFRIGVTFRSAAGSDAPRGLAVNGWLRPISATNLPCREAARSYRSTLGLPTGSVSLNGSLMAVSMADGALTLLDPAVNLQSANLAAATQLDAVPDTLVADPARVRFLAVMGAKGEVLAVDPLTGATTVLASGLDRPGAVVPAPDGGAFVLETGGARLLRIDAGGRVAEVEPDVTSLAWTGDYGVWAGRGGAVLFDIATGQQLAGFATADTPGAVTPLVVGEQAVGLAILAGDEVQLRYSDAPDLAIPVALTQPATTLRLSPDGRFLFAFDPAAGPVHVIDVARGRLVQAIAADVPIAEVGFTARAAFLLRADQASAGVIFFDTITEGAPPQLREVVLGQPLTAPWPKGQFLATLTNGAEIVAVHASSFTGFILHDNPAMGDKTWPMTSVQLRGGAPRQIAVVDRRFVETAPGQFRTIAVVPDSATGWELVLTTGLGGQTVCAELPTRIIAAPEARGPGTVRALPGDPLTLVLTGPDGQPADRLKLALTFSAPQANWRRRAKIETDADGRVIQQFLLPGVRPLIITAEAEDGRAFLPLALEE